MFNYTGFLPVVDTESDQDVAGILDAVGACHAVGAGATSYSNALATT